ncbi:MAG: hypothetical protein WCK02_17075 [Bacteroidota bacterium]
MKQILQNSFAILPGIYKALTIYFAPSESSIKSFSLINNQEFDEMNTADFAGTIEHFRKKRLTFSWQKPDEIPFEQKKPQNNQLDVFDELEASVLTIYIPNKYDHKNDLIILFMKPQLSSLGIMKDNLQLSTEHKSIIGTITRNWILKTLETIENDKSAYQSISDNTRYIIEKQNILKRDYEQTKEKYGESLINFAKYYLDEICKKNNLGEIFFTEQALRLIKFYSGEINRLKEIMEQAVFYVYNLYSDTENYQIEIDEVHLRFDKSSPKKSEIKTIIAPQYFKSIQLLDKLNEALKEVVERNENITGLNVGNACKPPISAPAITDSIKKHKAKLIYLLEKYPDKWIKLRLEFKPIINILPLNTSEKKFA